uniref:lysozyme n=1 Tax=Azumapecten farreri TaxID=106299 RepID=A0A173GPI3_AZUFA|nr:chlamysin [Azumapecten farreri]
MCIYLYPNSVENKDTLKMWSILLCFLMISEAASSSCQCSTENGLHARSGAGLSHSILVTLRSGECFKPTGDIVTHDGYHWHELENVHGHHRAWVVGVYVRTSSCGSSGTIHSFATGSVSQKCLNCICKHVSGCHNAPCKWDVYSNSCGYFQLKEAYWHDCGKPGSSFSACAGDLHCSSSCVQNYMKRFIGGSGCAHNCESYARIHGGGPAGCHHASTLHFWSAVESMGCSAHS